MDAKACGVLRVASAGAALNVLVLVAVVAGCSTRGGSSASCSGWSAGDRSAVESVPVELFLGSEPASDSYGAICDPSISHVLYMEVPLPEAASLPLGWYERDTIGQWTASRRTDDDDFGRRVCYLSATTPTVQVYVRESARSVEVSIDRDQKPCSA